MEYELEGRPATLSEIARVLGHRQVIEPGAYAVTNLIPLSANVKIENSAFTGGEGGTGMSVGTLSAADILRSNITAVTPLATKVPGMGVNVVPAEELLEFLAEWVFASEALIAAIDMVTRESLLTLMVEPDHAHIAPIDHAFLVDLFNNVVMLVNERRPGFIDIFGFAPRTAKVANNPVRPDDLVILKRAIEGLGGRVGAAHTPMDPSSHPEAGSW